MKKILMIVLLSIGSVAMADSVTYTHGVDVLDLIESSPGRMSFKLYECESKIVGEGFIDLNKDQVLAFNAGDALLRHLNNGTDMFDMVKTASGVVSLVTADNDNLEFLTCTLR